METNGDMEEINTVYSTLRYTTMAKQSLYALSELEEYLPEDVLDTIGSYLSGHTATVEQQLQYVEDTITNNMTSITVV